MASNLEKKPGIDTEQKDVIDGGITMRLGKLQEELKKNPKNPENIKIRGEISELKRELNRVKQYSSINTEAAKKLIEGKNMDSLSAAELMKIDRGEGTRGEFLSKSFLYKQTKDSEGNISEEPTNGKDLKEGDTLLVDFGKNKGPKSPNNRIGLGQMLPVDIGYVKVGDRIGVRTIINGRVGYYTSPTPSGYIPVFTGYTVTLPTATEIGEFEKKKDSQLQRNTNQEETNSANDLYIEKMDRQPASLSIELNVLTKESYDFWIESGFSPEQAAGIVANEYKESGCNPRAIGDSGEAKGIFQWHPDRRLAIKNGTGIDIDTAGHLDQLKAALWEMNHSESKVLGPLKSAKSAREAGAIFSELYERPANREGEMISRGNLAEAFLFQAKGGVLEGPESQRIETIAMLAKNSGDIMGAEHCTDWVDRVYLKATGKSVYNVRTFFNGVTPVSGGTGIGGSYAERGSLSNIGTGMHLMLDKPPYQSGKTHSVIALGAPIDGLVQVVSYPNGGIPPKVETYDLYAQGRGNKDGQVLRIQGV